MPFFWLKPGEMDIGGDGGRIYFYDPVNLIQHFGSYYVFPFGTGIGEAGFHYLPLIGMLAFLKQIFHSPYVLISLYNSMKVVIGFLSVYAIVKALVNEWGFKVGKEKLIEATSIIAGLFYIFNPAMTENYVRALPTHDQVFLNPLMFYLLLKYFTTSHFLYVWIALFVSVIFSNNFTYPAAPPFFAFYPLSILFILLYASFIRHIKIPWKGITIGFMAFIGLHAFHLIPEFFDLFYPGSNTNARVFDKADIVEQIGYFTGVLAIPKVSFHLLAYSLNSQLKLASVIIPSIIVLGFLGSAKKEKAVLLTGIFFLITLFFTTAKITHIGVEFYQRLFYIPGFTMFRNFYGQWQFVFYFFYAVLFGQALYIVLLNIRKTLIIILSSFLVLYLVINSWKFINGDLVNQLNTQTKDVKVGVVMDPKYEEVLQFLRSLPNDGKIILFPFTDYGYQVIHGTNNGAYVGHSTIGYLTGKLDFAGYADIAPFSDVFWKLSKEKNYEAIQRMFGLLNIQYIFYNADPLVYDTTFPTYPYSPDYVRKYLPNNQLEYKEYISRIAGERIFKQGSYEIYRVAKNYIVPHFSLPDQVYVYKDDPKLSVYGKASAFFDGKADINTAYLQEETCKKLFQEVDCMNKILLTQQKQPKIIFEKISPIKYKVKISEAQAAYLLVFSEAFHKNWNVFISPNAKKNTVSETVYFNGQIEEGKHGNSLINKDLLETFSLEQLPKPKHVLINGYANAWFISPKDVGGKQDYELIIEMTGQRLFYLGFSISIITLILIGMRFLARFWYNRKISYKTNYE